MHRRPKPPALAAGIVESFYESFDPKPIALSALNLGQAEVLPACLRDLADALLTAMATGADEPVRVLSAFAATSHDDYEPLWDFADLCRNLQKRSGNAAVVEAARSALERIGERPVPGRSRTAKTKFVAAQRRRPRGKKIRGLNGFGVYVPLFAERGASSCAGTIQRCDYNMNLIEGTRWDELIAQLHTNMKNLEGPAPAAHPAVLAPAPPLPPSPAEALADPTPFSPLRLEITLRENLRNLRMSPVAAM
jgi:hypothetical protein